MKLNKHKSTSGGSAFYSQVDLSQALFVFDLDNTLLTSQKTIDSNTMKAVQALKAHGADVSIATGRAYELAKPFAEALGVTVPIILNNGALIKSHHDNNIIHAKRLTPTVIKDFYDVATAHHFAYTLHTEDGFYINAKKSTAYYDEWNQLYPTSTVPYHLVEDVKTLMGIEAYKFLMIINDETVFEAKRREFADRTDCTITKSHTGLFDITPVDTHKGEALKTLIKTRAQPYKHVIVFGDNDNDAEMLQEASIGIAMANATKPCINAADMVSEGTSDTGGVYQILARFLRAE